jgi:hypothetical protein
LIQLDSTVSSAALCFKICIGQVKGDSCNGCFNQVLGRLVVILCAKFVMHFSLQSDWQDWDESQTESKVRLTKVKLGGKSDLGSQTGRKVRLEGLGGKSDWKDN